MTNIERAESETYGLRYRDIYLHENMLDIIYTYMYHDESKIYIRFQRHKTEARQQFSI